MYQPMHCESATTTDLLPTALFFQPSSRPGGRDPSASYLSSSRFPPLATRIPLRSHQFCDSSLNFSLLQFLFFFFFLPLDFSCSLNPSPNFSSFSLFEFFSFFSSRFFPLFKSFSKFFPPWIFLSSSFMEFFSFFSSWFFPLLKFFSKFFSPRFSSRIFSFSPLDFSSSLNPSPNFSLFEFFSPRIFPSSSLKKFFFLF